MRHVGNRLFDLTGFRGKTFWDWMGLLVVPLFIALATGALGFLQFHIENQRADALQKAEEDRADALRDADDDRAQQSVLQSYIQDMTQLLLDRELATSETDSLVWQVARAHTLSAIHQLDSGRNEILLRFLSGSNLLVSGSAALLRFADLGGANLSGANLWGADLSSANLSSANLSSAILINANLSSANLSGDANLNRAILIYAQLFGADLRDADLSGANLANAHLIGADLSGTDLSGADLRDADLSGARGLTNEQLAQAESMVGATLPDGTVMTEEAWEEFKKSYR